MLTSEEKAYAGFCRYRWPETGGLPICPRCGSDRYYELKNRRKFCCNECRLQYSATSGTIFHSRKLSYQDIMAGIEAANSYITASTLSLAKALDSEWRTVSILKQKAATLLSSEQFPGRDETWREKRKQRRPRPVRRMTYWPYLAEGHVESGTDLLHFADRLVPKGIPDFLRADMCQEIIVSLLSGEMTKAEISPKWIRHQIARVYRAYDLKYETVSLDVPIAVDSEMTFKELLTYDSLDRWDAPALGLAA